MTTTHHDVPGTRRLGTAPAPGELFPGRVIDQRPR